MTIKITANRQQIPSLVRSNITYAGWEAVGGGVLPGTLRVAVGAFVHHLLVEYSIYWCLLAHIACQCNSLTCNANNCQVIWNLKNVSLAEPNPIWKEQECKTLNTLTFAFHAYISQVEDFLVPWICFWFLLTLNNLKQSMEYETLTGRHVWGGGAT